MGAHVNGYWVASYVALWIVVLVLAAVVIALVRQIGVLHLRLSPAGALDLRAGPPVGEPAPAFAELPPHREALVLFGSEGCGLCRDLLPSATALARAEPSLHVLVLSASASFTELVRAPAHALADVGVVAQWRVRSTPFGVFVGADGVVRAKGIVNTLEHLESLVERGRADRRGTAA